MKKERNRFDALADELFEKPPEPKPEPTLTQVATEAASNIRKARVPKRDAYLSVMGMMYPVMSFDITTSLNAREYEYGIFAGRESHRVKVQLAGFLKNTRELLESDVVLVIHTGPEPEFLRLQVTDVRTTMSSSNSRFTEIEANATGIG